jgi:carboxypeptidase family protein
MAMTTKRTKGRLPRELLVTLVLVLAPALVWAQGGGASSTGVINGKVADSSAAVLPGVTVTIASPSMMGTKTDVTNDQGIYRFPAVPPGTYTVTYELPGFNTLKREGIDVRLGFTATVNVELQVASLQETVVVTGESPVIDTSATRVQQNFKLEQLQSIPNARDMWSLLAVTPAVTMSRIDVGGNRAGTQTGYTAYGFSGQVRVLIEGINTTEGTGGAGFYFDYASLEEVFLGTTGQGAEMPNPGVQSQFLAKSGGNRFSGEYYLDWYNNALQGSNIPGSYTSATAFNGSPIRPHSNEIQKYYDTAINIGGPVKKDRLWWFATYRDQKNAVQQPNFKFDKSFDTRLWNPVTKWTYQLNQKNKLVGYYQWGQKVQPNRLPFSTYTYDTPGPTYRQDSGSWVWKGEWNGTLNDRLYVEARYGDFGYYFPLIANSDEDYFWRDSGQAILTGANQKWQTDRDRKQLTGAATYFLDKGGSHTFKFGGEILKETQWEGYVQDVGGNIEHIYSNGRSNQVVFYLPTATGVGKLGAGPGGDLLTINKLDQANLFLNDTWSVGRVTLNLGARWDRYTSWVPEQSQLQARTGPVAIAAQTFPKTTFFTWNSFAPRLGFIFDLAGDGRSVVKANYGLFWHNPGPGIAGSANPNQAEKSVTYTWNDTNADKHWQPGEEGTVLDSALAGALSIDPNISQPYTHEAGVFFEREIADTFGTRVGFVYKTEDDLWTTYRPGRGLDAYTVPFAFTDIGEDGQRGTGDDRTLTLLGLPRASADAFPTDRVIMNVPRFSRYRTAEASLTRRYANRWSASIGGSHTWLRDFPNGYPNDPNAPGLGNRTTWDFKLTGSLDAGGGFRLSPVLRHQSGPNFARTISVPSSAASAVGLIYSGTIYADAANSHRQDNITVLDLRAEKTLNLGRSRLRAFLDLFNITNSHASETIVRSTGTSYLKPSAILAPFTTRVGFRFLW